MKGKHESTDGHTICKTTGHVRQEQAGEWLIKGQNSENFLTELNISGRLSRGTGLVQTLGFLSDFNSTSSGLCLDPISPKLISGHIFVISIFYMYFPSFALHKVLANIVRLQYPITLFDALWIMSLYFLITSWSTGIQSLNRFLAQSVVFTISKMSSNP